MPLFANKKKTTHQQRRAFYLRNTIGCTALSAALFLSMIAQPMHAAAEESNYRHETDLRVKFGGLTIATVTFGVSTEGNSYTFSGDGRTRGLADWFASGNAKLKSEGAVSGAKVVANNHFLAVTEGKKTATLKMAFRNGEVGEVLLKPDKRKKKKPGKHVMLEPQHFKNVVDPASTMVVPVPLEKAKDPLSVCSHTFKVYDGDTRFDIALSYKRNAPVKTEGYDGHAYVCKLRYIPVAGHERKHRGVKEMSQNNDMEIWLAPISGGAADQAIFTAIRIVVPTRYGTFYAEPDYFGPARS